MKNVLVALDMSRMSEAILPALDLVLQPGDAVTLLSVEDVTFGVMAAGPPPAGAERVKADSIKNEASAISAYLEGKAEYLRAKGLTVRTEVILGHEPAAAIAEFARQSGASLIAMSSYEVSAASKGKKRSIALDVIQSGVAPVLVLRPPARR